MRNERDVRCQRDLSFEGEDCTAVSWVYVNFRRKGQGTNERRKEGQQTLSLIDVGKVEQPKVNCFSHHPRRLGS